MRTVFMVEGAIDPDRLNRDLEQLAADVRGEPAAETAFRMTRSRSRSALDCRYLGQGYELRVALGSGAFTGDALEEFHRLHEQEYGHAFRDPIEIVNARATAIGRRPRIQAAPVPSGSLDAAALGEGESVYRRNGGLAALPTRYFERSRLPIGEPIAGPAIVFQRDTTVLVPPDWNATADEAGVLILSRTR